MKIDSASQKIHFKGLNGIRAIAAFAVVLSHIGLARKDFGFNNAESIDLGGFGVSIFFSLSGFLITYLLLIEKNKFATVDIKKFYVRRVLRIWPLYFFYLFLALITIYFYERDKLPGSSAYYFFIAANIPFVLNTALPHLVHYWSLAVEEQFYLFWPWVVKKSDKLLRIVILFTLCMIVAKILARVWASRSGQEFPYLLLHTTRFQCMSIGAIGAILFYRKHIWFLRIMNSVVAQVLGWGVLVLALFNKFHIASVIDSEIVAILTVVLIVNVSTNSKSLVSLDYPVFDFLGKISFGIYVYHPLIIYFFAKVFGQQVSQYAFYYKLIIIYTAIPVLTVIVSHLSYKLLEERFINAKARFSKVISSA